MITPQQFRSTFPAFSAPVPWSNEMIQFALDDAYANMDATRWGPLLDNYAMFRAAHYITLEGQSTNAVSRGASPGQASGVVSSKGVGPASISFDTGSGTLKNGEYWNTTIYGQRYWRKARLIGAGGMQLL